jgi:hypothetical protein
MKFGPLPDMIPYFRLTVATPRLSVAFEAHPREWRDPKPAYLYAGPSDISQLCPFMRGQASNVLFDMGLVDGSRTFMKVATTSLDVQDLRVAYRWVVTGCLPVCGRQLSAGLFLVAPAAGIVNTWAVHVLCAARFVPCLTNNTPLLYASPASSAPFVLIRRLQEFVRQSKLLAAEAEASGAVAPEEYSGGEEGEGEGDDGMVTPHSHFSDSEQTTPTFADIDRLRSGVAKAAAAGSREAADSLAPPEVRQRVLSDAAAELMLDELDDEQGQMLVAGRTAVATTQRGQGAAEVEVPVGDDEACGDALDTARSADDPMVSIYRAARNATRQLQHQSSDVPTLAQPSPPSTQTGGSRWRGGEEGSPSTMIDTPATPSTGGFSFMLPGSQQPLPAHTPGMVAAGSGSISGAGSGLPPGLAVDGRRGSLLDPNPHTGIRLSGMGGGRRRHAFCRVPMQAAALDRVPALGLQSRLRKGAAPSCARC